MMHNTDTQHITRINPRVSTPIPFGRWIREQREGQALTIRALSERTQLDIATISRLENLLSQPTLSTAIRLCEGLDSDLSEPIAAIKKANLPDRTMGNSGILMGNNVLDFYDIELFLTFFQAQEVEAKRLLFNLINRIQISKKLEDKMNFPLPQEGIDVLFERSLLLSVQLQYPQIDDPEFFTRIYRYGGAFILEDARAFLEASYHATSHKRSISNVFARVNQTTYERIKLIDILKLDDELVAHGMVASIYLYAYRFQNDSSQLASQIIQTTGSNLDVKRYYRLAKLLVIICRWLQWLLPNDNGWQVEFRESVKRVAPTTKS